MHMYTRAQLHIQVHVHVYMYMYICTYMYIPLIITSLPNVHKDDLKIFILFEMLNIYIILSGGDTKESRVPVSSKISTWTWLR